VVVDEERQQPRKSRDDLMIKILAGLVVLLVIAAVGIGGFLLGREDTADDGVSEAVTSEEPQFDYSVLNEIREVLDRDYVRPENLDDQSLFEAAVNGMLGILNDTGTFYVTPEDYQTSTVLTGSFETMSVGAPIWCCSCAWGGSGTFAMSVSAGSRSRRR
jgi:hypothetical protein